MYESNFVIFVGVAAAVVGLLLGAGLHRGVGSSAAKMRGLKKSLELAEQKNRDYQQHVADHFSETASLLNGLTRQYKSIHDHLATGADTLCRDASGQSMLAGSPIELTIEERVTPEQEAPAVQPHLQPPLDYAPKAETSNSGTLSEEYGLEKVKLHEQADASKSAANSEKAAQPAAGHDVDIKIPPNVHTA